MSFEISKAERWGFALVIALFSLIRFIALDQSPPGFYVDEAAIAAQTICLRQSGHDLHQAAHPLFSHVLGGGCATAPFLYLGGLWTGVFGDSISSFRGFSALFGILFIASSFFLGWRWWLSERAGWLTALSAAVSPWAFQFARISWDPALAPAFSALALALLLAQGRRAALQAGAGGVCAALAMYSYPPLRLQLFLILPFIFLWLLSRDRSAWRKTLLPFVTMLVLVASPLIFLTLRGDIQGRFEVLSVFNKNYLSQFGEPSFTAGLGAFAHQFVLNFSPKYLFISGDGNLRHSTQAVGEWSWLDMLGLVMIITAAWSARRQWRVHPKLITTFALAGFGYIAGVIPAALTWESNPHALRSIGAVVFLALLVGGGLALFWRRHVVFRILIIGTAVGFACLHLSDFFLSYPARSALWFDTEMSERLSKGQPPMGEYPELAIKYYELASGQQRCLPQ